MSQGYGGCVAGLAALVFAVVEVAAAGKLGLCCESCNATQYGPFSAAGSWAYRYSLFVDDADSAKWLGDNSVEFVPHLAHKQVPLPDGSSCTINGTAATKNIPLCTAEALDGALRFNSNSLSMKYLMGWNEAYDSSGAKAWKVQKKYIAPVDAATYWRTVVQGLGQLWLAMAGRGWPNRAWHTPRFVFRGVLV